MFHGFGQRTEKKRKANKFSCIGCPRKQKEQNMSTFRRQNHGRGDTLKEFKSTEVSSSPKYKASHISP